MNSDFESGIKGLKQIWKSMIIERKTDDNKFADYSKRLLDRHGYLRWYSK